MKPKIPYLKPEPSGRQRLRKERRRERDPEVVLTGIIKGLEASAPEEYLALAADANSLVDWYEFRRVYNGISRTATNAIELDFLFSAGGVLIPAQVDEEFFHASAAERAKDRFKDEVLYNILMYRGARRVSRIRASILGSIEAAMRVLDDMIYGRVLTLDDG